MLRTHRTKEKALVKAGKKPFYLKKGRYRISICTSSSMSSPPRSHHEIETTSFPTMII